jgi:hypothetical protein
VSGTGRFAATIRKSGNELVRVTVDEYRGRQVLDVRVWAVAESGEVIPTRRGVTIAVERLPELVRALTGALAAVSPTREPAA